jgi:small subunit ribosomal protein S9
MADEEQNGTPPEEEGAEQPEAPEEAEAPEAGAEETPDGEAPEGSEPESEQPEAGEEPAAEESQPAEQDEPKAEEPKAEEPKAEEAPTAEAEEKPDKPRGKKGKKKEEAEVIPGEHLEPDLVLEEERAEAVGEAVGVEIEAAEEALAEDVPSEGEPAAPPAEAPVAREPLDLAADARYSATGKRKSAVARVILRPGSGAYTVNGRELDQFFPRPTLQKLARGPLDTAGYGSRMDVVAKIHGGGVSAQAGALRHGIARALVEADPNLRVELKRRGFLTRDARVKERKKAGLKKARKRPQFSKR